MQGSRFHCDNFYTYICWALIILTILLNSIFVLILSWHFAREFLHSLGIINTSTIWSLLKHEHGMLSHSFLLKIIFHRVLWFSVGQPCISFVYLYFSLLMIINDLPFHFPEHANAVRFQMSVFYSATCLSSLHYF